jgi:hypothetical protein
VSSASRFKFVCSAGVADRLLVGGVSNSESEPFLNVVIDLDGVLNNTTTDKLWSSLEGVVHNSDVIGIELCDSESCWYGSTAGFLSTLTQVSQQSSRYCHEPSQQHKHKSQPKYVSVKVTFGCTHVALLRRQPQDSLGLLSP